ncbi:MAG: amidohydrolase family protein [Pseudomonadota bacterium]|nr:amidohydrolase family protein [Pseudomonadota bacterium]
MRAVRKTVVPILLLAAVLPLAGRATERGPPRPMMMLPGPEAGGARMTALVGGTVLPMDSPDPGATLADATVLFQGDRIVAVGPRADVVVPANARVIDVAGRWVLPGLIDAHVHVFDERDLPLFLAAGVTSVVNMSGSPLLLEWRRGLDEGARTGPRMWTTGPMIDEATDPLFGTTEEVGSEADAARVVGAHAAAGYDVVKLHGDLEVGLYDAVIDAASAHHLRVVGHLSERVGLLHAMKRHQATVEHTEEFVYAFFNGRLERRRIPTVVAAVRASGAAVTPTLVSIDRIAKMLTDDIDALAARPTNAWMPPLETANWGRANNPFRRAHGPADAAWFEQSLTFQEELVRAFDQADVPLFAGTDSGWVPYLVHGDALPDELAALDDAGVAPARVLAAATRAPGGFYGGEAGPGTLAKGRPADVLVVDADPLVDIRNVRRIDTVVARGRVYRRAELDALVAGVRSRGAPEAPLASALARGDVTGALSLAAEMATRGRAEEPTMRSLAMRLSQSGHVAAARQALVLGARANPTSWSARELAGRALVHEGRAQEGLIELRAALARSPGAAATQELQREIAGAEGAVIESG